MVHVAIHRHGEYSRPTLLMGTQAADVSAMQSYRNDALSRDQHHARSRANRHGNANKLDFEWLAEKLHELFVVDSFGRRGGGGFAREHVPLTRASGNCRTGNKKPQRPGADCGFFTSGRSRPHVFTLLAIERSTCSDHAGGRQQLADETVPAGNACRTYKHDVLRLKREMLG